MKDIEIKTLDVMLSHFFMLLKQQKDSTKDYEPGSIATYYSLVKKYIEGERTDLDEVKLPLCCDIIKTKKKELKQKVSLSYAIHIQLNHV